MAFVMPLLIAYTMPHAQSLVGRLSEPRFLAALEGSRTACISADAFSTRSSKPALKDAMLPEELAAPLREQAFRHTDFLFRI